ncbi:MAG: hypothetical protein AAB486_01970 [Patescibacteria group bacterium]
MAKTFTASVCANLDFATFFYSERILAAGGVGGCFGLRYKGELLPKGAVPMGCLKFNWQTVHTEFLLVEPEMTPAQKVAWEAFFWGEKSRFHIANADLVELEDWTGHTDGSGFTIFLRSGFAGCISQNPKDGTAEVYMTLDTNDNPIGYGVYEARGYLGCLGLEQIKRCVLFVDGLKDLTVENW